MGGGGGDGGGVGNVGGGGLLLLDELDEGFQHWRIRGEAGVRRHGNDGVDFDEDLVAGLDDIVHAAHGVDGDLANHVLDEVELLPRVVARFSQVRVAVRDTYRGLLCHFAPLLRIAYSAIIFA